MKLSKPGMLLAFGPPAIAILGYVLQAPWLFLGVTVVWLLLLQALDAVAGHERGVPWSALRNEIRPPSSRAGYALSEILSLKLLPGGSPGCSRQRPFTSNTQP